jgi:hypothetical protein
MRALAAACALALAGAAATAHPEAPARTPTPVHRLSGGFGRPRATPPPPADGGQSLADVVRAAKEARHQNDNPAREKSGVTIDNRSLVTNPDKGRVSTSRVAPGKEHAPAAAVPPASRNAPPEAAPAAAPSPATSQASEAEWREIARAARKRAADARARVGELEAAVKKLENDFYAWDDGQYRDRVIKPAWDKTRDQLEDARREVAAAEKDLTDLPERARRAGAQPGWIRE